MAADLPTLWHLKKIIKGVQLYVSMLVDKLIITLVNRHCQFTFLQENPETSFGINSRALHIAPDSSKLLWKL